MRLQPKAQRSLCCVSRGSGVPCVKSCVSFDIEGTMKSTKRLRCWFSSLRPTSKGLLLGFTIPLALSFAFGLIGSVSGTQRHDSLGSYVIDAAVFTFDLPGLIFASFFTTGMLGPGDESFSMMLLEISTLPACLFWTFFGWCVGKSKLRDEELMRAADTTALR
jgi:hypothetical protein